MNNFLTIIGGHTKTMWTVFWTFLTPSPLRGQFYQGGRKQIFYGGARLNKKNEIMKILEIFTK